MVGKRTVLYDKEKQAPLNEFESLLKNDDNKKKQNHCASMKLDKNGDLVVDLDQKIDYFRTEYKKLALQIEALCKRNELEKVENYQGRLDYLQRKRDILNEQVSLLYNDDNKEEVKLI